MRLTMWWMYISPMWKANWGLASQILWMAKYKHKDTRQKKKTSSNELPSISLMCEAGYQSEVGRLLLAGSSFRSGPRSLLASLSVDHPHQHRYFEHFLMQPPHSSGESQYLCKALWLTIYRVFFYCSSQFSVPKWKVRFSQQSHFFKKLWM